MHKPTISAQANRDSVNREPEMARTIAATPMGIPRMAGSIKFERLFRPVDRWENIRSVHTRNGKTKANNSQPLQ